MSTVNDSVMDAIRAKYEVLDRIIKHPQYDGKAIKDEAWQAFQEIHVLTADLAAATRRAEIAEAALSRYVSVGWWSEGNGFTPSGLAAGREPETASATRFMKRRGDQRVYIIRDALAARTDPGSETT